MASSAERAFVELSCAKGTRHDGRTCTDYRQIAIETDVVPTAVGSCRLTLGATAVTASVIGDVIDAAPGAGHVGRVVVHLEGDGGDHQDLRPAERWLQQCLSSPACDALLESLAVKKSGLCWELHVHVFIVRAQGNCVDAMSMAVLCALHVCRLPRVVMNAPQSEEETSPAEFDLDTVDSGALPDDALESVPLCATLWQIGAAFVVDCDVLEEQCHTAAVRVACDGEGSVCGLASSGPVDGVRFGRAVRTASHFARLARARLLDRLGKAARSQGLKAAGAVRRSP